LLTRGYRNCDIETTSTVAIYQYISDNIPSPRHALGLGISVVSEIPYRERVPIHPHRNRPPKHSIYLATTVMRPPVPQIFARWLQEPNVELAWSQPSAEPSYITSSSGEKYIAKLGKASNREQFIGEAESLKALQLCAPRLVPKLIASGFVDERGEDSNDGDPYFLSEYKKLGPLTGESASKLGKRLATEVHAYKGTHGFGFAVPTFCGATRLDNGWYSSWQECYDSLIQGLLSRLSRQGGFAALCAKGEQVRKR
jgi:protein-ribulosamine 3-kinase